MKPLLVFSSFRTGSTWLWTRFRDLEGVCAYKEVFHERLSITNKKDILRFTSSAWPSRHSSEVRYFEEYQSLLSDQGGVHRFDPRMSFEWMMPHPDAEHRVRSEEAAYLDLLCSAAIEKGRMPILTFNRATSRVQGIRSTLGGSTVLLTRSLAAQWASYLDLRQAGVDYFLRTAFRSIQQVLLDSGWRNDMMIFLPPNCDVSEQGLKALTVEEAWIAFVGMNLIHFAIALPFIDLRIDIGKLSTDGDYLWQTQRSLSEMLGKEVDLSGVRVSHSLDHEVHELVRRSSAHLTEKVETFIQSNEFENSTQFFLRELVSDTQKCCSAPRSDERGSNRVVLLAERGLIAWEKRVQSRSIESIDFEAELDALEDALFPPAFRFWTKFTHFPLANN